MSEGSLDAHDRPHGIHDDATDDRYLVRNPRQIRQLPGYADTLSEAEQLALVRAVRDLRKP